MWISRITLPASPSLLEHPMRHLATLALFAIVTFTAAFACGEDKVPKALNFTMKNIDGKDVKLGDYQGKVLLVVNVASECGLTPQYEQLQALHEEYADKGLVILGFPCNQFGKQEPGTADEIKSFCSENYGVKFPLMAKVDVNGDDACAFYNHLTLLDLKPKGAGKVSWNFEKFIFNKNGEPIARFEPKTKPDAKELLDVIEVELKRQ
jgi:glutathione peroxidase